MKSDMIELRHARSRKDFPEIKLEENEFVKLVIRRSPIYLVLIWAGEIVATAALLVLLVFLSSSSKSNAVLNLNEESVSFLNLVVYIALGAIWIAGLIGTKVYRGNKLFVTNKRLIQKAMTSLFASSTNVIDLISVEDVSFKQAGILEHVMKIGTLRMSTVGDETTYTFKYVDTPTNELELITHLVHVEKEKDKEN